MAEEYNPDAAEKIKSLQEQVQAMIELNDSNCALARRKEQEFYEHCARYNGIEEDRDAWKAEAEKYMRAHAVELQTLNNFISALTPSPDTKCAYSGEFYVDVWYHDQEAEVEQEDEPVMVKHKVMIPWTTIKDIMKMIKEKAIL